MPIFKHVLITPQSLSDIRRESRKVLFRETGGALVGRALKNDTLLVTAASGPGPRAVLERHSVLIDGEFTQRFCDQARRQTGGTEDYVGDWHKHTGLSLEPSTQDIRAMQIMANFEYSPTNFPISLIYRRRCEAFSTYIWDGSDKLRPISSSVKLPFLRPIS
jgi:integrative and conjugative element protein (TIGR02256 family)